MPWAKQQRLDPVLDAQLVSHEVLALAVRALGVFFVWRRHAHHTAHMPVATKPDGEQRSMPSASSRSVLARRARQFTRMLVGSST